MRLLTCSAMVLFLLAGAAVAEEPVESFTDLQHQAHRASTKEFFCFATGRTVYGSPEVLIVKRSKVRVVSPSVPVRTLEKYGFRFGDAIAIQRAVHRWAAKETGLPGNMCCAMWNGEQSKDHHGEQVVGVLMIEPDLVNWEDVDADRLGGVSRLWSDGAALWGGLHQGFVNHRQFATAIPTGEKSNGKVGAFLIKRDPENIGLATFDTLAR